MKLAVIDHNSNVKRPQAMIKSKRKGGGEVGGKRWKIQCSKVSKDWVAKEVKSPKSIVFAKDLLAEVILLKEMGTNLETPLTELEGILTSPRNIAPVDRPEVSGIIQRRESLSRFKKV